MLVTTLPGDNHIAGVQVSSCQNSHVISRTAASDMIRRHLFQVRLHIGLKHSRILGVSIQQMPWLSGRSQV